MQIVTLTSDFGYKDHSVATLKGKLLSVNQGLQLVDISHGITPYSIEEAAYVFKVAYRSFPPGTIHIINVFEFYKEQNELLIFKFGEHYFIGPNNGLFSLIFWPLPDLIYSVELHAQNGFPVQTTISSIVGKLLDGNHPSDIGKSVESITQKLNLQAVVSKNEIRGSIVYFDHYGNAVVNIHRDLFEQIRGDREFALFFKRFDPIYKMSKHYMDAEIGEPICKFNSRGYLEIAVTLGRAEKLLGLKKGDAIQIEFN